MFHSFDNTIYADMGILIQMTYGQRLQQAMDMAKKTRKQLAAELGCSVQALGMVITGAGKAERSLTARSNALAARYLKVDGYWLATGEGESTPGNKKALAGLSDDALEIAIHFDMLIDKSDRTRAYVAAMAEVIKVLAAREAKHGEPASNAPAKAANPKKQHA